MNSKQLGLRGVRVAGLVALCLAIAALLVPGSVYAQDLKPLEIAPDINGVDLIQGKIRGTRPVLAVPASGRLQFDRIRDYNLKVVGHVSSGGQASVTVETGATSETFTCSIEEAPVCQDIAGRGSKLIGTVLGGHFRYMEGGTGREIVFSDVAQKSSGADGSDFTTYATSIIYPDGESLTIGHNSSGIWRRPSGVASSLGYKIQFTYKSNDINNGGWQVVGSATLHKLDQATQTYGAAIAGLTYTTNAGGDPIIVDDLGREFISTASDTTGGSGYESGSRYQLPDTTTDQILATAKNFTATNGSTFNGVGSVKRDGATYNYDYTVAGYSVALSAWSISQVRVSGPEGYYRKIDIDPATPSGRPALVRKVTDSQGNSTSYDYDTIGWNLEKVTSPEGNSVSVKRDLIGNIIERRQKAKPSKPAPDIVERAVYPAVDINGNSCEFPDLRTVTCFRATSTFDALNNETKYTYNSNGLLVTQLSPPNSAGERTLMKRTYSGGRILTEEVCEGDANGNALTCGTANSRLKTYTYWENTKLPLTETISDGLGGDPITVSYSYDDAGRLLSQDGPLPGTGDATYFGYDAVGRKIWEVGPIGENGDRPATKFILRDADDQPIQIDMGRVPGTNVTGFVRTNVLNKQYDSRRRLRQEVGNASGANLTRTNTSYDGRNRPTCKAVRMNADDFASATWDACTPQTTGDNGIDRITRTYYDTEGRTSKIVQGYGSTLERDYATYTYSDNGQLESMTDARGYKAEMRYDGFDRQTHWYFPSKTAPGTISTGDYEKYTYDNNGNRTELRKRDGSVITYTYDNLNRVRKKAITGYPAGLAAEYRRPVWYTYTVFGESKRVTFDTASGEGTRSFYDAHGRLDRENYYDGSVSRYLYHTYNLAGSRTSLKFPDSKTFTYEYSSGGQFDLAKDPSGTQLFNFDYDANGRLETLERNDVAADQDFTYDGLGRLATLGWANAGTNSVSWGYTRNPASQILTETQSNDAYSWNGYQPVDRTYAVNGLNQYTKVKGADFCYDDNGNLTADGAINAQGVLEGFAYRYDVENRLVEMRARVGANCPTPTNYTGQMKAKLTYDPLGRLATVENYINGVAQGPIRFLHDGDALVGEYNAAGTMLARHIHGPAAGADDPLVSYAGSSVAYANARFLYADPRGSIVFKSDRSGANQTVMAYDPYGVPGPGHDTFGRFGYTGQVWLEELGMNYYKARMYSPTLGRFLQVDPIGYEDNVNLYGYVGNDPLNSVDPTGTIRSRCQIIEGSCSSNGLQGMQGVKMAGSRIEGNSSFQSATIGIPSSPEGSGYGEGSTSFGASTKSGIPAPPENLPGGPYTEKPATSGNRPGSFQGPKPEKGPRSQAQWVPPESEGGPENSEGYWKTQQPGERGWQRYNQQGEAITPEEAHPSSGNIESPTRTFWFLGPIGAVLCLLFCESPAN